MIQKIWGNEAGEINLSVPESSIPCKIAQLTIALTVAAANQERHRQWIQQHELRTEPRPCKVISLSADKVSQQGFLLTVEFLEQAFMHHSRCEEAGWIISKLATRPIT